MRVADFMLLWNVIGVIFLINLYNSVYKYITRGKWESAISAVIILFVHETISSPLKNAPRDGEISIINCLILIFATIYYLVFYS